MDETIICKIIKQLKISKNFNFLDFSASEKVKNTFGIK